MYSRRDLKEFENQSISANRDRSPVSDNRYTATNTTNYTTTATTAAVDDVIVDFFHSKLK
ncbi:13590_t:CDS:2 [Entrophospora sp. SA101]|nr:13590_t:CDS:2 [Entrophospora sp. SA101]